MCLTPVAWLAAGASDELEGWKEPPPEIKEIVTHPLTPSLSFSPDRSMVCPPPSSHRARPLSTCLYPASPGGQHT